MKLDSILATINENTNVKIFDYFSGDLLSHYDGKNSIDSTLNNSDIADISAHNSVIEIIVIND